MHAQESLGNDGAQWQFGEQIVALLKNEKQIFFRLQCPEKWCHLVNVLVGVGSLRLHFISEVVSEMGREMLTKSNKPHTQRTLC